MSTDISIRRRFLIDLVVVILVLGGTIFAVSLYGSRRAVRSLSDRIIDQSIQQAENELTWYFNPIRVGLEAVHSWSQAGLIDLSEPDKINELLIPLIEELPQLSSLMVADETGCEHMLLETAKGWTNRRLRRNDGGHAVEVLEWKNKSDSPTVSSGDMDYDPRERPWFIGAVEKWTEASVSLDHSESGLNVYWTEPYEFFTTREPGITASICFVDGRGKQRVVGFDVLLRDISEFTSNMKVLDNGQVVVLTLDDRVIGLPHWQRYQSVLGATGIEALAQLDMLDSSLFKEAAGLFQQQERDLEGLKGPLRFSCQGKPWWGANKMYSLSGDRGLKITVLVPEADLLGELYEMRLWILGIIALTLICAIYRAFLLARRYSQPIEALVAGSKRISEGDLEGGEIVRSSLREVNQLAEAQDQMRAGLKTLLKLERDLQLARQIQRKTLPETIPKIKAYDVAAWNQPADQTGGDTYDIIGLRDGDHGGTGELTTDRPDRVIFLVGDAAGHGIGPALSVTQLRAMIRIALRLGPTTSDILRYVNAQLYADLPDNRFITMWISHLDVRRHRLHSFSAGQAPLLFYRCETGVCEILAADSFPLGIVEEMKIEKDEFLTLEKGDIFAVISDGIFEACNDSSEQFGSERVVKIIRQNSDASAESILGIIRSTVKSFSAHQPPDDDQTILIIKRR
jgi:serine phosphatase RsbU (regulator of sigma subunit)